MILYRIEYTNRDTNKTCRSWVGTQAEAKSKYRELVALHDRFNVDKPEQVNVPTDKTNLLLWLNGGA